MSLWGLRSLKGLIVGVGILLCSVSSPESLKVKILPFNNRLWARSLIFRGAFVSFKKHPPEDEEWCCQSVGRKGSLTFISCTIYQTEIPLELLLAAAVEGKICNSRKNYFYWKNSIRWKGLSLPSPYDVAPIPSRKPRCQGVQDWTPRVMYTSSQGF